MTIQDLLAAVGLPAATDVADRDLTLVDSLLDLVGYTSQGHLPEVEAVAVLDARLGGGAAEGYLFTTAGDDWVLVVADAERILDITPVSRAGLIRDLRHHLHDVQGILRRLQGPPKRSSLRR